MRNTKQNDFKEVFNNSVKELRHIKLEELKIDIKEFKKKFKYQSVKDVIDDLVHEIEKIQLEELK